MSSTCFLALPLELRHQIYASHFRTLTLTYPTFTLPPLLYTSHQIYTEALPFLRSNATYDLVTTERFTNYLNTLTPTSLSQLRHISVAGLSFCFDPPDFAVDLRYHTHVFASFLPFHPGLQLDTLAIRDVCHRRDVDGENFRIGTRYDYLEEMIREGKGWKELVFTSATDRWLEGEVHQSHHSDGIVTTWKDDRGARPGAWDRMVKERDGLDSGACAEMWSREEDGVWRKVKEDYVAKVKDEDGEGYGERHVLRKRPSVIEVRVKRGQGAEYVQDGKPVNNDSRDLVVK